MRRILFLFYHSLNHVSHPNIFSQIWSTKLLTKVVTYPGLAVTWQLSWEGGLSPTNVGMQISKSLGTFWMLGSVKLTLPANRMNHVTACFTFT